MTLVISNVIYIYIYMTLVASGLPLERGGSSAVGSGRAGRPDHYQQHCYHQAPTVNQRPLLQLL